MISEMATFVCLLSRHFPVLNWQNFNFANKKRKPINFCLFLYGQMTSHLPLTWKRKINWMISFQSFTDTHVHAFSCNYRIKKQNTPCSYFCTNNVGCICTVNGCLISTIVLLCAALTLPPSGFWLQRLFWSSFSVFWKENLKFEMEKTAGFKCWSGHKP